MVCIPAFIGWQESFGGMRTQPALFIFDSGGSFEVTYTRLIGSRDSRPGRLRRGRELDARRGCCQPKHRLNHNGGGQHANSSPCSTRGDYADTATHIGQYDRL
jgi:hypothetical protein